MKKILSFVTAGLLALGLIGCSGDLHNKVLARIDLSAGAVPGAFNDWDNTTPWTSVDKDKGIYTYEFEADAAEIEWKIITTAGNWNSGAYGAHDEKGKIFEAGSKEALALDYDGATGGEKNAILTGLTKGSKYLLTIEATDDSKILVKSLVSTGAASGPKPFIFNGMFVVGSFILDGCTGHSWNTTSAATALMKYDVDKKTQNVTYVKNFNAGGESDSFRICGSDWKGGYGITEVTVGADPVKLSAEPLKDNGEIENSSIKGLKAGYPYKLIIAVNPDGEVTAQVEEVIAVTLKVLVTGINASHEGKIAVLGGSFDGWSGWTSCWTPADQTPKTYKQMAWAEITDKGTAEITLFSMKAMSLGEEVNYEACGYYGEPTDDDDISKADGDIKVTLPDGSKKDNFKISFKVEKSGVYVCTVDLAADKASTAYVAE